METEDRYLCCVGCGRRVSKPAKHLAISCRCGAMSPFLYLEGLGQVHSFPGSFLVLKINYALSGKNPNMPHIEYFLGRSRHTSPMKADTEASLRAIGCISENECPECVQRTVSTANEIVGGERTKE